MRRSGSIAWRGRAATEASAARSNDPIGKLALASVAHRPGPGRSEQVRRL